MFKILNETILGTMYWVTRLPYFTRASYFFYAIINLLMFLTLCLSIILDWSELKNLIISMTSITLLFSWWKHSFFDKMTIEMLRDTYKPKALFRALGLAIYSFNILSIIYILFYT